MSKSLLRLTTTNLVNSHQNIATTTTTQASMNNLAHKRLSVTEIKEIIRKKDSIISMMKNTHSVIDESPDAYYL